MNVIRFSFGLFQQAQKIIGEKMINPDTPIFIEHENSGEGWKQMDDRINLDALRVENEQLRDRWNKLAKFVDQREAINAHNPVVARSYQVVLAEMKALKDSTRSEDCLHVAITVREGWVHCFYCGKLMNIEQERDEGKC
jgi:hypothetical protein